MVAAQGIIPIGSSLTFGGTNAPDTYSATTTFSSTPVLVDNGAVKIWQTQTATGSNSEWDVFYMQTTNGGPLAGNINGYWNIVMNFTFSGAVNFDGVVNQWLVNGTPVSPITNGIGSICCAATSNPILPGPAYYNTGFTVPYPAGPFSNWQQVFVTPYSLVSSGGINPSTANEFIFALHFTLQQATTKITSLVGFDNITALSPGAYGFAYLTNLGTNPTATVNGVKATVISVQTNFLSFQVPRTVSIGPGSLVIQSSTGTTAPFAFTINATSPAIGLNTVTPPFSYFFDVVPVFVPHPTPSPGDRLYIYVDGLGASVPPPAPRVQIDGKDITVLGVTTFNAFIGGANTGPLTAVSIQIPGLPGGPHVLTAIAGTSTSPPETFIIIADGLIASQTGLTFNTVQGGAQPPSQSFSVLSGLGPLTFSVAVNTVNGGSWLSATPLSGSTNFGTAGAPIQVTANPAGLAAGNYYGQIVISAPGVPNSPQIVTVVLTVAPAGTSVTPSIDRTGVIFTSSPGGANPPAKMVTLFNPTSTSVAFTVALAGPPGQPNPFQISTSSGTLTPGQALPASIQASATGAAGAYSAKLTFNFAGGTSRAVNLLLILAPGATASASTLGERPLASTSCTPTKLLPVFTLLGDNFTVPAAWPTPLEAAIDDDCGTPLLTGSADVAFSNGDPPLRMTSNQNGKWSATWPPVNARPSGITLTLTAREQENNLTGTASVGGGVSANPSVPIVSQGGVGEAASYASPVSPGNLVAIFGSNLAPSTVQASSVPLQSTLGTTSAILGGQPVPLYYASNGQVNAIVPYGLATNTRHQLVVQVGNNISVPQSVLLGDTRPAVFTIDQSGSGQGHIYKYDAQGNQIRADKNAPAKTGDSLVVYCSGLGAVNPALGAGTVTPLSFLTKTVAAVTVTIGGVPVPVAFAGLTPGSVGLYQINATVPPGLANNDATSFQVSAGGQDSPVVTFAVRN